MLEWTCWFVWQRLMKLNYNYASISGCLHHQVTFSTVIHVGIAYSMQRTRSRLFSDETLFPRTDEYEYHLLDSLVWFQESYLSLLCIKYEQGYFSVWMWRQNLIEWHCGQMVKTFDCRTKVKCPSFESTCCFTGFLVFFFFFLHDIHATLSYVKVYQALPLLTFPHRTGGSVGTMLRIYSVPDPPT